MTNPTPRDSAQLPALPIPFIQAHEDAGAYYPATFSAQQMRAYAEAYAREALRAQAASPADMAVYQGIADGYQRDAQAASVEPVEEAGKYHVERRTNACADVCDSQGRAYATCAWTTDAHQRAELICTLLNGSAQVDASSPATAVDAVDELTALVAAVDAEMADSWGCNSYHPTLRPALEAARRTALQASRPPVTQQAVAEGADTARAFIEWCKAQPEDRVPVSIDEALDEFEKHLATKEQCS